MDRNTTKCVECGRVYNVGVNVRCPRCKAPKKPPTDRGLMWIK